MTRNNTGEAPVAPTVPDGRIAFALGVLLMSTALLACSSTVGESQPSAEIIPSPIPPPIGKEILTPSPIPPPAGKEIFAANCAVCHGEFGHGQPNWHISKPDGTLPPPPLNGDGHTWHHGDGLLYLIVSQGGKSQEDPRFPQFKSAMPSFGEKLSHEEIVAVLTYVKSLWKDKTSRGMSIVEAQAAASELDPFPEAAQ